MKKPVCPKCEGSRTEETKFPQWGDWYCADCSQWFNAPGFTTKDSGERIEFASGMKRDTDAGKIKWHLVTAGPMLKRWAELLTRGAAKYDDNNWMKAAGQAELDRFRASAMRHFMQWMAGDTDEDHASACIFNLNGAEFVKERMAANA